MFFPRKKKFFGAEIYREGPPTIKTLTGGYIPKTTRCKKEKEYTWGERTRGRFGPTQKEGGVACVKNYSERGGVV